MPEVENIGQIKVKVKKTKVDVFSNRIAIIDFLRGALILLVFFDHFMYNLRDFLPGFYEAIGTDGGWFYNFSQWFILGNGPDSYFHNLWRVNIRELCLAAFVFLSGISCAFSKDNWKRAGRMIAFWLALAFITNIANGYQDKLDLGFYSLVINFNVIGVIALSCLGYCFVQYKSPQFLLWCALGLFLFAFFILPIFEEQLMFESTMFLPFFKPMSIVVNGKPYNMADYMPLFPYMIYFFLGAIIAKIKYKNPAEHIHSNKNWMRPFCFVGRHSLLFYLGHQFVFYAIFIIVGLSLGVY